MDAVYSEIFTGEHNKKETSSCVHKLKQCLYTHTHTHTHTHTRVCVCVCMYVCIYIYIYICCIYSANHSLSYVSIEKHYGHNIMPLFH